MPPFQILPFPIFQESKGDLIPFELDENFPFEVKRVYLVTGKKGLSRGGHAHKVESEVFVAASGSITATIHDGTTEEKIILNQKNKGLLVRPYCWHEFSDFSEDAVMLCFSSTHYLPGERNYITDKEKFLEQKKSL